MIKKKYIKTILWFMPVVVFFFFFNLNIVPNGSLEKKINPLKEMEAPFFSYVDENNNEYLSVAGQYFFTVQVPRAFNSAKIKTSFKFRSSQSNVYLGAKAANGAYSRTLIYAYDYELENLPSYWNLMSDGDYVLAQKDVEAEKKYVEALEQYETRKEDIKKEYDNQLTQSNEKFSFGLITSQELENKKESLASEFEQAQAVLDETLNVGNEHVLYKSILDFLSDSDKDFRKVINLNQTSDHNFFLKGNLPSVQLVESTVLRGDQTFFVYYNGEGKFNFEIKYRDSNKHLGEDDISLIISQDKKILQKVIREDDGILNATDKPSPSSIISIDDLSLKEGLYIIRLEASNDIFITSYSTNSSYVAMDHAIHPAENNEYNNILQRAPKQPVTLYTNTTHLRLSTAHEKGFQSIRVNNQIIDIAEVGKEYVVEDLPIVSKITLPKSDIEILSDGLFVFDKENPLLSYKRNNVDTLTKNLLDDANFVYAYYPRGVNIDDEGLIEITESVEVPQITFQNNQAQFYLDFGALGVDSRSVILGDIDITMNKAPITFTKIISKIRDFTF